MQQKKWNNKDITCDSLFWSPCRSILRYWAASGKLRSKSPLWITLYTFYSHFNMFSVRICNYVGLFALFQALILGTKKHRIAPTQQNNQNLMSWLQYGPRTSTKHKFKNVLNAFPKFVLWKFYQKMANLMCWGFLRWKHKKICMYYFSFGFCIRVTQSWIYLSHVNIPNKSFILNRIWKSTKNPTYL